MKRLAKSLMARNRSTKLYLQGMATITFDHSLGNVRRVVSKGSLNGDKRAIKGDITRAMEMMQKEIELVG
jgi:hypothetical protein